MTPQATGTSTQSVVRRALGTFGSRIASAGANIAELIIPGRCAACGVEIGPDAEDLCESCWTALSRMVGTPHCVGCGDDTGPHLLIDEQCTKCRLKPRPFDLFVRVGVYSDPLRSLLLRFKREFILDRLLGRLLRDVLAGRLAFSGIDYWVPIPSHWRRRIWRGFQPTALLARASIPKSIGGVDPLLTTTRYVPPFHHNSSAQDRSKAIAGAFRLVRGAAVRGRSVVVIDDVSTTGATLKEAARVMRAGGASRVIVAVIARAGRGSAQA